MWYKTNAIDIDVSRRDAFQNEVSRARRLAAQFEETEKNQVRF